MKNYWIRFKQPTEDYRPLTFPPNEQIKGWWCTGYDDEERAIICAFVSGKNPDKAILKDWPEAKDLDMVERDGFILGNRFPVGDWMKKRGLSNKN